MIFKLPWRFLIWFVISFLLVEGIIEMNMSEGSKTKEILLVSFSGKIAGVVTLLFEGAYQISRWCYRTINKE